MNQRSFIAFDHNTMTEGHSFHFSLPEGLKLLGIGLDNGVPYLRFGSYPKVPAITEEDWAAILRLVYVDERRPEFYFARFVKGHPFEGRWFNQHGVEWMRGTSLGDLLLEVDWSMKCLQAGVRSDKNKNLFKAWKEASNLEGLADARDFPTDRPNGPVYMTCKNISVISDDAGLTFDGEPKMCIADHSSSSYSNYITTHFDSVAYHDEPLFLKIREVVKLTIAAEWLRDRKVPISIDWVMEKTATSKRVNPEVALLPLKEKTAVMKNALRVLKTQPVEVTSHRPLFAIPFPLFPLVCNEVRIERARMSVRKVDISCPNRAVIFGERTYESNKRKETVVIKATVDDYDWLYKDTKFDPKFHLPVISTGGFPLHHNCQTLAELYKQTTPYPTSWLYGLPVPDSDVAVPEFFGGVNLRDIPVSSATPAAASTKPSARGKKKAQKRNGANSSTHLPTQQPVLSSTENSQYCGEGNTLRVSATRGVQKPESVKPARSLIPPFRTVKVPPSDVRGSTELGRMRQHDLAVSGAKTASGQTDASTGGLQLHDSETGQILQRTVSVRTRTEVQSEGNNVGMPEFGVISVNQPVARENSSPIVEPRPTALVTQEPANAAASDLMSPTGTDDSGISSELGEPGPNPDQLEEESDGDSSVDPALDLEASDSRDDR